MKNKIVLIISVAPILLLSAAAFLEAPMRLNSNFSPEVADAFGWMRIVGGITAIVVMVYFVQFVLRSTDSELRQKRGLWVAVLLFANVFALPAFWFFHYRRLCKASSIAST